MAILVLLIVAAYASVLPPAAGQNYQYSCIHYCEYEKYGETQSYCCRMAKVFQKNIKGNTPPTVEERVCPPVRSYCPRTNKFAPPETCTTDEECTSPDKCCYDKCLELYICKTSVKKRYRRATSETSESTNEDDPGASKPATVVVTNGGKIINVVVDGNQNPVTVAEGEAVTIIGQGPVHISNTQDITIVDGTSQGISSDSASHKVKRSIKKENSTVSNINVTNTDVVSVIKDEHGNVVVNKERKPLVLIQKENGGPTLVVNSKGLKVVAGHGTKTKNSTQGVVTRTAVPELKAERRRRRRGASETEVQSSIMDEDGNEVTDVNGNGHLKVENQDKVMFTVTVPAVPPLDATVTETLTVSISENDNTKAHVALGEHGAISLNEGTINLTNEPPSTSLPDASKTTNRRRRTALLAVAIVDGNEIAVTLVNATDDILSVVGGMGERVTVVEGDYLLDIGEATKAILKFNEDSPVLTDDKGMILMDKNGSPLSVKPASSVERATLKAFCIVDGEDKKVNLVDTRGVTVQAYAADMSRIVLCEGIYELEVGARNIVHIEKTSDGVFIVTQQGSALTDENGDLLHALPSETREVVALHQYVLLDGSGNQIHLITREGLPTKIIDNNGNEIEVKGATKNLITVDVKVTAVLENNVVVLKGSSGKQIVDENNFPVTLSPAPKSSRRRRAVNGYYVVDSLGNRITLTDQNDVPLPLVADGEKVPVLSGETIMRTELSFAVVFRRGEGLYIGDESGNVLVDSEDNPLMLILPSELAQLESMKVILDGNGNEIIPIGTNNKVATVVDDQGDVVTVKTGVVKIKIGTNSATIVKTDDGVDRLVDNFGNVVMDVNKKPLEVLNERKKAGNVRTHVLLNGEGKPVTLTTQDGTAVTMMDGNGKMVVIEGEEELSADIPDVVRTKRSTNEINLVDDDGFKLADEMGNPLRIKKMEDHLEDLDSKTMLVDGEGTSLNLVGLDNSPITILDEMDETVSVLKGEKTLRVEASFLRILATSAESRDKMLVDESGNAIFSDSGLIEIVESERDERQQSGNLMVVTEDFVELSLSLRRLSATIEESKVSVGETDVFAYRAIYQEVNLFVYQAGQLQKKCVKKMMDLMQNDNSAFEAYSLLGEMEEMNEMYQSP